jgi:flagellar hook-basal body complex protein FliE
MTDPLGLIGRVNPGIGPMPGVAPSAELAPGAPSFKDALLKNLAEVDRLQQDADQAMEDFAARKRTDLEGVLLAAQKADTAFKAVQAIRNKVIQAYEEIQQMRV